MDEKIKTIPLLEIYVKMNPQMIVEGDTESCCIEVFDWINAFADGDFPLTWIQHQSVSNVMETSQMLMDIAKVLRMKCDSLSESNPELKLKYILGEDGKCFFEFDEKAFFDSAGNISSDDIKIVEAVLQLLYVSKSDTLHAMDSFLQFLTNSDDEENKTLKELLLFGIAADSEYEGDLNK